MRVVGGRPRPRLGVLELLMPAESVSFSLLLRLTFIFARLFNEWLICAFERFLRGFQGIVSKCVVLLCRRIAGVQYNHARLL